MSKDTAKNAHKEPAAAPVIFDLRDRVPQMTDVALATLKDNAARLKDQGTTVQRTSATDLLPVVEAEIARRRAEKLAAAPSKTKKKAAPKAKAKAEADADAEAEAEAE